MLSHPQKTPSDREKAERRARRKWHDDFHNVPSIGCATCPEYSICGGLKVSRPLFWCLDYCCARPETCDVVCRNNLKFVDYTREVGGFDLNTVCRSPQLAKPNIPSAIPMLFHGNSRSRPLRVTAVALPFARMFDRRTGEVRFESRSELCTAFMIDSEATVILSGTDSDPPIENWWALGRKTRAKIIHGLRKLGVAAMTSPNYSLFIDQPRWDDLHAMKRIAIVHSEILNEGLPVALHVNGRTESDFQRWTTYVRSRPEIQTLAYEFATGTGWVGRRELHVRWLIDLALRVGRPLDLIVRGGIELLPALTGVFAQVTFIDTAAFMRSMKRRRAIVMETGKLSWCPAPTEVGMPLDSLLDHNVTTVMTWIRSQFVPLKPKKLTA
jgi:hypothetical protein